MYLLRSIYANGNEYKTIDEIFNSLDPKIDKQEFDKLLSRLRQLVYLDENNNNNSNKIRINNIGEAEIKRLDRQEETERKLRNSLLPAKKPLNQTIKTIFWTYIYPAGKWTMKKIMHIFIEIIIVIAAAYFIFKCKIPH